MRSYWSREGPISNTTGICARREDTQRHPGKRVTWPRRWRGQWCTTSQGLSGATRSWESSMSHTLPWSLWEEPTSPTPWPQTTGLLNLQRINFCCFKPPSWWCFVMAVLETKWCGQVGVQELRLENKKWGESNLNPNLVKQVIRVIAS